jgi:hypothetical protein
MRVNLRIVVAIACLALPVLACQTLMGGGGSGGGGTDTPATTTTPSPKVILSDDFSSAKWGTGTDSDSSVQYANNALQIIVYKKNYFVWSTPNTESYQNFHTEVSVLNNGTDSSTVFGIICNQQEVKNNFYYLAIKPTGEYAIVKAADGQQDAFLTNDGAWTASDKIAKDAPSYRVGADCGNGTLTLYVDGQQVASVSDASYTGGHIALFVWSGENAQTTNVSFDDFLMTELPQ